MRRRDDAGADPGGPDGGAAGLPGRWRAGPIRNGSPGARAQRRVAWALGRPLGFPLGDDGRGGSRALSPGAGGCAIVGGQPCWQAATSTWPCPNEVDGTEHVCGAAELHTLQSGLPWCAKAQDCLAGVGCKVGTKYVGGSGH